MNRVYKILKALSTGHVPGQIVRGNTFKNQGIINALVENRAIAEIAGPPLSELPGWVTRSEKLAKLGILNVNDFLAASPRSIADEFNYKITTIEKWRSEVEAWMLAVSVPAKVTR